VAVVTLGCPKNLVDSEVMAGVIGRAGFTLTGDPEAAEAIVINTCAFIGPAREEAWERIGEAAGLRRAGRCRALVVAGCLAQGFAGEIHERFPEVDRVLGTGEVEEVARVLRDALGGVSPPRPEETATVPPGYVPRGPAARLLSTPPHYAYLKIAEGCNHRCAFCLIPALRGPYRSRPPEDLVREARSLEALGVRELVLVAQDTTVYGRDLPGGGIGLTGLVRRLLEETGVDWIRVLYGYPSTLPDDFVTLLAEQAREGGGRLCRYLDLPMQHASDRVLRAMRRPETGDFLLRTVDRLRRAVPGVTIRSTFIVGFPGEDENDFQVLLDFLRETRLDYVGFFPYSREAGTPAADLPGQIPDEVKEERLARAAAVQREVARERRRSLVGRDLTVIVDEVRTARPVQRARSGMKVIGRSEGDAPGIDGRVLIAWSDGAGRAEPPAPGDFVEVSVTAAGPYDLRARPRRT